jgi:ATP-binding cassette subfamily C (CFTR/MRP) protein 4
VLQQAFIISSYSIHDNLDPEHKRSESEINHALQQAQLSDFNSKSMTSSLSTGQIQLLSLAQAFLSNEPKIVLLDEPTSQIDATT